jgi:DMSO/TMAO reductase YedYZ molybdopterin-dependent catalytic subunit
MAEPVDRRAALALGGLGVGAIASAPLWAQAMVDLGLSEGTGQRPLTDAFPGKKGMILQRSRAPLLETPMAAFDGALEDDPATPNDRFYVRWHYADIPLSVDAAAFRLRIGGAVKRAVSLSLAEIQAMPQVTVAAVNQCSGNSRGLFGPRVPGAQWGNGAMGNARWTGVRLRDLIARAGTAPGVIQVRCAGLDQPPGDAPHFAKSLALDHAENDDVIVAYGMNGAALPLLNGFPLRLIVPGWYSTYWVKALDSIELLTRPDSGFWMAKAYQIPDTGNAGVKPGASGFPTVPISRMPPRAFFTRTTPQEARGIAMGGDAGVASVDLSLDHGKSWRTAQLGPDHGPYSFRRWAMPLADLPRGTHELAVRTTNTRGEAQTLAPIWNPGGYMRSSIETARVVVA